MNAGGSLQRGTSREVITVAYYRVCPDCGSYLDPSEKCECQKEKEDRKRLLEKYIDLEPKTGQLIFKFSYIGKELRV